MTEQRQRIKRNAYTLFSSHAGERVASSPAFDSFQRTHFPVRSTAKHGLSQYMSDAVFGISNQYSMYGVRGTA